MNATGRSATRFSYLSLLLLGWVSVLVPTLIVSVERRFGEADSGIGLFYLVGAVSYVTGSLGGGPIVERLGRRVAFPAAGLFVAAGLISEGLAPLWAVFVVGGSLQGLGAGALEVCANSLVMDLYPDERCGALSLLHVFYAVGAMIAPVALAWFVRLGVGWQVLTASTGLLGCVLAALMVLLQMPSGRRARQDLRTKTHRRIRLPAAVAVLCAAVALYVASEAGISGWVVRYLSTVPTHLAPVALTMFWGGLAVGRVLSARTSHRFDLVRLSLACATVGAMVLVMAVLMPVPEGAVVLFAVVGLAYGPIYPSVMALAGREHPDRAASVSGVIGTAAFAGQSVYPPVMGLVAPVLGLGIGMLGAAGLVLASGLVVASLRRLARGEAMRAGASAR